MSIQIDRLLPVPIPVQLQGQIEYGMVNGDFPPGSRLPSVRELSAELGVSPVTVSEAYRHLAARGFIKSVPGRGTFVRASRAVGGDRAGAHRLEAEVARLILEAERMGIGRAGVVELVQRSVSSAESGARAVRIVFVGVYLDATRTYAGALRRYLRRDDRIVASTFDRLREEPAEGAALVHSDLILTFAHREHELAPLLPEEARVATVELAPSKRTRVALAEIEPHARVALVSQYPEFLATFRRGVGRFASHVASVTPLLLNAPDLRDALAEVDVVVYGTGADDVLDELPGSVQALEYRHEPDPVHVERSLLPLLARLRAGHPHRRRDAAPAT